MRIPDLDETSGERARDADECSDSRRWVTDHPPPEPVPGRSHGMVALVLLIIAVLAAYRMLF